MVHYRMTATRVKMVNAGETTGGIDDVGPVRVLRTEAEAIEAAATFADEIRADASDRDRHRRLPFVELRQLARTGLLGITVPKSHGGLGISCRNLVEIFKIISTADPSIGQIPQNHHVFVRAVELEGDEAQKAFFFNQLLDGAQFGNALSERGTKTVLEFKTRLTPSCDGKFRLDGRKFYCTGALFAAWIPVFALGEHDKLVVAYVPRNAKGLTVIDDWSGIGQRVTASGSVLLENVEVPAGHVVPLWRNYERPQTLGAFAQIMHVAIDVGIAAAALGDAASFVRERTRPWAESGLARAADEPHLIKRFGELYVALQGADALLERAAISLDEAGLKNITEEAATRASVAVAAAKSFSTQVAIETTNALFELAGTASMDASQNLDRHWRNARIHTLHDPARWKQFHLGNWYLNGIAPPRVYS
jgi:SfnB family sulfur acquisition oxidoreductase